MPEQTKTSTTPNTSQRDDGLQLRNSQPTATTAQPATPAEPAVAAEPTTTTESEAAPQPQEQPTRPATVLPHTLSIDHLYRLFDVSDQLKEILGKNKEKGTPLDWEKFAKNKTAILGLEACLRSIFDQVAEMKSCQVGAPVIVRVEQLPEPDRELDVGDITQSDLDDLLDSVANPNTADNDSPGNLLDD